MRSQMNFIRHSVDTCHTQILGARGIVHILCKKFTPWVKNPNHCIFFAIGPIWGANLSWSVSRSDHLHALTNDGTLWFDKLRNRLCLKSVRIHGIEMKLWQWLDKASTGSVQWMIQSWWHNVTKLERSDKNKTKAESLSFSKHITFRSNSKEDTVILDFYPGGKFFAQNVNKLLVFREHLRSEYDIWMRLF